MSMSKYVPYVVLSMVLLVVLEGCGRPPVVRSFAVEDLLFTAQELPPKWVLQGQYVTGCLSKEPCVRRVAPLPLSPELEETWQRNGVDGSREDVFAEFALFAADGDTVLIQGTQNVLLYSSPAIAHSHYTGEVDVYQFSQSLVWEDVLPHKAFTSPYAAQWRLGCSWGQSFKEKCLYYAVYEEFVVRFSLIVRDADAPVAIDRDEFMGLVEILDKKIGSMVYDTDEVLE